MGKIVNKWLTVIASLAVFTGCSPADTSTDQVDENAVIRHLNGMWITEADGSIMADPQTSGLIVYNDQLVTISDGSALAEQRRKLHFIAPQTAVVEQKTPSMSMASRVRRSCFAQYLSDEPDFEAIVVDPDQPDVFIIVTEDATRSGAMTPRCQQRYEQTGSTDYPTLLVRAVLSGERVTLTHVRPIQYKAEHNVGDFPNDGIEGMAFGPDRELFLGLEKDADGQPRIFSVTIDDAFWSSTDFAPVTDPKLLLPTFERGNHPINGMDYMALGDNHPGLIVAAARNDEQLWLVDLAKKEPTQIIDLVFYAPSLSDAEECEAFEKMDNASLEGVAVDGAAVWLVNDPWKRNYLKNIQCESNRERYEAMAPLLFKLQMEPEWLSVYTADKLKTGA